MVTKDRKRRARLTDALQRARWELWEAEMVFRGVPVQYIGGEDLDGILKLRETCRKAQENWESSEFVPFKEGVRVVSIAEGPSTYDDNMMPRDVAGTVSGTYTAGVNMKGSITQVVWGDDGYTYWVHKRDLELV